MMQTTETRELVDLERQFWNAMQSRDAKAAGAMTDDGCVIVGAQGVSAVDAATMEKLTSEGKWEIRDFSFDDRTMQARRITDDVVVVAYKVNEQLTVDGKPLTLEANDASVWVRRDGRWLCALHTESVSGDPFGRDRKP
jgi:uncharacterized protein (TIGR02246 family)